MWKQKKFIWYFEKKDHQRKIQNQWIKVPNNLPGFAMILSCGFNIIYICKNQMENDNTIKRQ